MQRLKPWKNEQPINFPAKVTIQKRMISSSSGQMERRAVAPIKGKQDWTWWRRQLQNS